MWPPDVPQNFFPKYRLRKKKPTVECTLLISSKALVSIAQTNPPPSLHRHSSIMETNMNDQNYLPYNPQNMPEIDPDFEPVNRNRSNTWPINRPDHLQNLEFNQKLETCTEDLHGSASSSFNLNTGIPDVTLFEQDESPDPNDELSPASIKKSSSRRNAWGNHSYADLITQAIQNSPEKRLTLSQIYEWMVQNVDYFKDKGDSNSSAGWKVSRFFVLWLVLIGLIS